MIREIKGQSYHIHYIGFDSSWDEWVDDSRIRQR
ncbi:MAG: Tudor-knot domain-containing protein [Candidatus Poseidoniaceae archaeon]